MRSSGVCGALRVPASAKGGGEEEQGVSVEEIEVEHVAEGRQNVRQQRMRT